jgi:hypothetical protein
MPISFNSANNDNNDILGSLVNNTLKDAKTYFKQRSLSPEKRCQPTSLLKTKIYPSNNNISIHSNSKMSNQKKLNAILNPVISGDGNESLCEDYTYVNKYNTLYCEPKYLTMPNRRNNNYKTNLSNLDVGDNVTIDIDSESTYLPVFCKMLIIHQGAVKIKPQPTPTPSPSLATVNDNKDTMSLDQNQYQSESSKFCPNFQSKLFKVVNKVNLNDKISDFVDLNDTKILSPKKSKGYLDNERKTFLNLSKNEAAPVRNIKFPIENKEVSGISLPILIKTTGQEEASSSNRLLKSPISFPNNSASTTKRNLAKPVPSFKSTVSTGVDTDDLIDFLNLENINKGALMSVMSLNNENLIAIANSNTCVGSMLSSSAKEFFLMERRYRSKVKKSFEINFIYLNK